MIRTIRGIIHGKTIELDQDPGVAEGQAVELQMKLVPGDEKWGEGVLRTAGALQDDPEWDVIMEEIYQLRKKESRRQIDFSE